MEKQIPIYFDSVVVSSPIQEIVGGDSSIGRLKVRVFTKYGNRNGSYITDAVADQLIQSAVKGNTPVVGFFDPGTQTWASHTGPTLANGYGYVEDFLGWEPFTDTDGVSREYAVFSVVLFTNYFDEAKNIMGQNQSMELNPETISGEWTYINDEEYFVYSRAEMLGFCIIGSHEPCFSVSSFFSKNDNEYKTQYEKFSSLLFDLKARVEEAERKKEGGENPMQEFENEEQKVEEQPAQQEEEVTPTEFEEEVESVEETEVESEVTEETEEVIEEQPEEEVEETEPSEFEKLQHQLEELQANLDTAAARIAELEALQASQKTEIESLYAKNNDLQAAVTNYEKQAVDAELARKNTLIEKYEKIIEGAEEITAIKGLINNLSYDELEGKLAVVYANQHMSDVEETAKVPLTEPAESQFALLMKKYRKN